MHISLHEIESITIDKPSYISTGANVVHITFTKLNGETVDISVFSDSLDKLEVRSMEASDA